jgi:hypothetical protein
MQYSRAVSMSDLIGLSGLFLAGIIAGAISK